MTTKRLAGLTLGAFALFVLARPPRPTGTLWDVMSRDARASDRAARQRTATLDTIRRIDHSLWLRRVRDSTVRTVAALPVNGRNQVFVDARIAPSLRAHIQRVYTDTRRQIGGDVALPMFVVVDTTPFDDRTTSLWIDSLGTSQPTCATVVRVFVSSADLKANHLASRQADMRQLIRALRSNFPQRRHFGLCSFEAAFGPPSASVRRWLAERQFYAIGSGFDPSLKPRKFAFVSDEGIDFDATWISWWRGGENGLRTLWLRACAAGRLASCADAVAPMGDRTAFTDGDIASNWRQSVWWDWRGSPDLMNAMAQSLGAQKFAELWKADATPFESYRRLTGVTADTLSRRLLVGEAPMRLGAAPTLWEALAALLVAALFAGLSVLSHPRRRH